MCGLITRRLACKASLFDLQTHASHCVCYITVLEEDFPSMRPAFPPLASQLAAEPTSLALSLLSEGSSSFSPSPCLRSFACSAYLSISVSSLPSTAPLATKPTFSSTWTLLPISLSSLLELLHLTLSPHEDARTWFLHSLARFFWKWPSVLQKLLIPFKANLLKSLISCLWLAVSSISSLRLFSTVHNTATCCHVLITCFSCPTNSSCIFQSFRGSTFGGVESDHKKI